MSAAAGTGLAGEVGRYAAGLSYGDLPADVLATLELCLDFNLGIGRAGYRQLDGLGDAYVGAGGGPAEATVWAGGERGAAGRVAFANAMAVHARAQDDFQHSAHCHIGAVVIPALLAVGESRRATGRELLAALAVGYQVCSALGSVAAWRTSAKGLRATPLYGPLGGAAAVSRLLGGDAERIANAVRLAANFASGFNHAWTEGTLEWRTQVGNAAETSIRCAELAALGAEAGPTTLEGPFGFFAVHSGEPADPAAIAAGLREWRLADMQMKPRPVCGINQGPAVSAVSIAAEPGFDPDRVERVRIRMRPEDVAYPGITGKGPFNGPGTALMSTSFALATALSEGEISFDDLKPPYDGRVLELIARVEIEADDSLPELGHVLTVADRDGGELRREYLDPMHLGALRRREVDDVLALVAAETGDDRVADPARREAIARLGPDDIPIERLVAVL